MIKKTIQHGNSSAIVIDKPILKVLNIKPDTELKISTDGTSIIITPVDALPQHKMEKVSDNEKVQKAFERVMREYSAALKKLSKA
jgi:antitoxin component of MazEF toxin-antitoxin module